MPNKAQPLPNNSFQTFKQLNNSQLIHNRSCNILILHPSNQASALSMISKFSITLLNNVTFTHLISNQGKSLRNG